MHEGEKLTSIDKNRRKCYLPYYKVLSMKKSLIAEDKGFYNLLIEE
jgi:hypothetical protein